MLEQPAGNSLEQDNRETDHRCNGRCRFSPGGAVRHRDSICERGDGGYVVDGDTIRLRSGTYVRLIGIDTPEVGECGYGAAKRKVGPVGGGRLRLVNPAGVDDRDGYGRLLRYVHDSGRTTGLGLIRLGLAKARYG